MKTFGKMLMCLFSAILLGTLLMILVYMLPVEPMREHVKVVISTIAQGGLHPSWAGYPHKSAPSDLSKVNISEQFNKLRLFTKLDNFTDAVMLNISTYEGHNPVSDAMLNPSLHYSGAKPPENLNKVINKDTDEHPVTTNYARYWHGYLVYLKPLLMTIDIPVIKMLNLFLQLIMFTIIIIKISDKLGGAYGIAFALAVLVIDPISTAMCFQYSDVYYIILATMIIMLCRNHKFMENNTYCFLFMSIGIVTSYFDFLTYPFASLGISTVLYLLLNDNLKFITKIRT